MSATNDPVFPLDQQLHRRTRPQIEGQLQLLGHFAYHQCTDTLRLFDAELARLARAPAVNPVALFGNANGDRRRQEYHCRISSSDGSGDSVLKEVNHAVINNWDAGTSCSDADQGNFIGRCIVDFASVQNPT